MYTYTYEWSHGTGASMIRLMTARYRKNASKRVIGFKLKPSVTVSGMTGNGKITVRMFAIPLQHLSAITDEIYAERARLRAIGE
jgi:hypothetical protein